MKKTNKINLKVLYILLGFFILFFASFILINEYTLVSGEKVYLKTVPVDPRDLLRGDYVILSYEISQESKVQNLIKEENLTNGDNIYFILDKNEKDLGSLNRVSLTKPDNELFIKGKIDTTSWGRNNLELGIGKYFVPENRGREIERLRGQLNVLVSIDKYGTAKIKDLYYNGTKIDFKK